MPIARKKTEVLQTLKKQKVKKLVIWFSILAIPLTLFLVFYFALGGDNRNYNYQLVKTNYQMLFVEHKYQDINTNNFTTKGWNDVEEIINIYDLSKDEKPIYNKNAEISQVSNNNDYIGEIYGVKVANFEKGTGVFANWNNILVFMILDSKIDGIIYYGN